MNQKTNSVVARLFEGKLTVEQTVAQLLAESFKVGDNVAAVDDSTTPFSGQRGVIRNLREDGYAEVEFPNGTKVPLLVSLLIKAG